MSPIPHWKLPSAACAGLLSLALFLSIVSCQKVPKPTSDSTPPKLVWNVLDKATNANADHPGSPTINAHRGDKFHVTLKANDPEGVKSIELNPTLGAGEISWTCKAPPGGENIAQTKTADLGPQTQNLSPDASGNVLTSIFLIQDLDFAMDCQSGWVFTSGKATLTGRAGNYFGGTTTEALTFTVSP
ncbi:MAG TPA: hypothetical protein VGQ72_13985 [Pyrinomonadaceae bacterium]|jgi:hypothetical protein|nr:hypothetical protein [Pyrinomonadaceae bacterium]